MAHNIPDPYAALGVKQDASADEIKKSYRRLAREYHPDSTGGDKNKEARFKEISSAYGIIGDPDKRTQYDAMRQATERGGPGGIPEGIFDLGDLFASLFAGGGGANGSAGPGVSYRVYTSGDSGGAEGFPGFGQFGSFGSPRPRAPQPRKRARPKKRKPKPKRVKLSDSSTAEVRGLDIYSELRLEVDQAILGTSSSVATIDGKATVRVPPGTSSGVKLRLKNKGLQGSGGARGNHFVTVQIDVPRTVSDEATRRLVQFMKAVRKDKDS